MMRILLLSFLFASAFADPIRLSDFGGMPNDDSEAACFVNSEALTNALYAADRNDPSSDSSTVYIAANESYTIINVKLYGLTGVTLKIDGHLAATDNQYLWVDGNILPDYEHPAILYFQDCNDITLTGSGDIDGRGYNWWWKTLLTGDDNRPFLIHFFTCERVTLSQLHVHDPPFWTIFLHTVLDSLAENLRITVDVYKQQSLLKQFNRWDTAKGIPTFPLNTDGIDIIGQNVTVRHCNVSNWDDVVTVKSTKSNGTYSDCSNNIHAHDLNIQYGLGMSIGSIPPAEQVNCVRDVLYENIHMTEPLKAIYIKTDPGNEGSGTVSNITYRNFTVERPIWMPIWIGPQQQHQPGQPNKGCSFFYPIVKECITQPLVQISNINLIDIRMSKAVMMPGVILCDPRMPCTNITMSYVDITGIMFIQHSFICENAYLNTLNASPQPHCTYNTTQRLLIE